MKIRSLNPATIIASLALLFSLTGTAVAGALVTGATVKNGSLTGVDLKDNSVGTKDIKNGTLLPIDFKGGALPAGPQGPEGPAGPPGSAGAQGEPGLSGVEVVNAISAVNSTPLRSVNAACPAGKKPVGGGAYVGIGLALVDELALSASYPTASGWTAAAVENDAYAGNWYVRAYAICANVAS
jgi:hypothetical protein